jgi:hypothetical protein
MPTPVLDKTYEFDVNHVAISTITELMFQMKNKLIGNGATAFSNPPTVKSSSNASVANNSDNWNSASDITFQAVFMGPRSWIVFSCPNVAAGLEVCWSCEDNPGGGANQWEVFYSDAAGFTGGTTTARPTAADEMNSYVGGSAAELDGFSTLATAPARLHVVQSTDGQVLHIWAYTAGVMLGYWGLHRPKNPAALWTQPWVAINSWYKYNSGNNAAQMTYAKMGGQGNKFAVTYAGGVLSIVRFSGEAYFTGGASTETMIGIAQTIPNELDPDEFPVLPIGLVSTTVGSRGRNGQLVDMFWGMQLLNTGDHFPNDASMGFVLLDDIIVPWAGPSAGLMKTF